MVHADLATFLAYRVGELDPSSEAELEQHYLGCEQCSARLGEIEAIASGVRRVFSAGAIGAVLAPAFAEQLRASGTRIREYHVEANGSVNCSVAPEDDLLLSRLQAPLQGVTRVDLVVGDLRFEDVPFDASSGEVVLTPGTEHIRGMPAHRLIMRLVAVDAQGERVLGDYTFDHTPHA
jgi:hypothetical protein